MKSEQLDGLFEVLTKDKDGSPRITESLTNNDLVKRFYPDHKEYIDLILGELQAYGGNSFANIFRGGGVQYREILCDVCDAIKVNFSKNSSIEWIEGSVLLKLLENAIEKMSPDEAKEVAKSLEIKPKDFTPMGIMVALQMAIQKNGFMTYKIALIVVNAVWKALYNHEVQLTTNTAGTISKGVGILSGPIGWAITGLWTAVSISGPAYRVTIPAVIQIAYLRQLSQHEDNEDNEEQDILNEESK